MAVRTRAQLNSDATTLINDNSVGDISPADVRGRIQDLADSAVLSEDLTVTKETATVGGSIDLKEGTNNGAHRVRVKAPDSVAADATVTMPGVTGHVLSTAETKQIATGYTLSPYNGGTVSSGTFTPDAANGNYQYFTRNGAFTFAAPAADCAIDILMTNGASAGAVTFSGYTVGTTGDALTTTNAHRFLISIRRINGVSTYLIKALQ